MVWTSNVTTATPDNASTLTPTALVELSDYRPLAAGHWPQMASHAYTVVTPTCPVLYNSDANVPVLYNSDANVPVLCNSDANVPVLCNSDTNVPVLHNSDANVPVLCNSDANVPVLHNSYTNVPKVKQ